MLTEASNLRNSPQNTIDGDSLCFEAFVSRERAKAEIEPEDKGWNWIWLRKDALIWVASNGKFAIQSRICLLWKSNEVDFLEASKYSPDDFPPPTGQQFNEPANIHSSIDTYLIGIQSKVVEEVNVGNWNDVCVYTKLPVRMITCGGRGISDEVFASKVVIRWKFVVRGILGNVGNEVLSWRWYNEPGSSGEVRNDRMAGN
jgi:hypothetical protein